MAEDTPKKSQATFSNKESAALGGTGHDPWVQTGTRAKVEGFSCCVGWNPE